MTGYTYPDGLPGHVAHSRTSREAAQSIKDATGNLEKIVLDYLVSQGDYGATDHEIDSALEPESTLRPRRVGLHKKGQVEDSGERRQTKSGRWATVWRVVPKEGQGTLL